MIVIFVISVGCALAALGEVRFSLAGFVCQTGAVLVRPSDPLSRSLLSDADLERNFRGA